VHLSLGVFAMAGVLGIINELKQPSLTGRSVYDVDFSILGTLLQGLEDEIDVRMKKSDVPEGTIRASLPNNDKTNVSGNILASNTDEKIMVMVKNKDKGEQNVNRKENVFRRIRKRIKQRKN